MFYLAGKKRKVITIALEVSNSSYIGGGGAQVGTDTTLDIGVCPLVKN